MWVTQGERVIATLRINGRTYVSAYVKLEHQLAHRASPRKLLRREKAERVVTGRDIRIIASWWIRKLVVQVDAGKTERANKVLI